MGGAAADPPLALLVPGTVCGAVAALAVLIAGSDFRPREYPSAKNSAQIPTRPKNKTSSLPVPSVISVSCDAAITQPPAIFRARLAWLLFLTQSSLVQRRRLFPTTSAVPRRSPPEPGKSQSYFSPRQSRSESASSAAAR